MIGSLSLLLDSSDLKMNIGYARTSTVDQIAGFESQLQELKTINCEKIFQEQASSIENRGYKILPSRTINLKLIENNWDDILRFMATMKLKYSSASQLFKRLSSYAKDHPLYRAIKEFGRIIKSILFLLTLMMLN